MTARAKRQMTRGWRPQLRRRVCCGWLTIAAIAFSGASQAEQWTIGVDATGQLERRENPLLVADHPQTISGLGIEVDTALVCATENSELEFVPRLRSVRYDGASNFDTDEQYLDLRYGHSEERYNWRVGTGLARDTTLTSELVDTGIIDSRKRHQLSSFSGTFAASPTARDQLGAQLNYQHNSYADAEVTGLVGYDYAAAALTYSRSLSERVSIGSQLSGGRLNVPKTGLISRDYGARLTLTSQLAPAWRLALSAGLDRTVADDRSDTGTVYDLELARSALLTEWRLTVGRNVVPSGSGALVHRADYAFTFSRKLSERLGASFDLRHVNNEDLRVGLVRENRQYERAGAALEWQAAEHWSLSLTAAYTQQAFQSGGFDAHGFDGGVRLVWSMPRRAVSQ